MPGRKLLQALSRRPINGTQNCLPYLLFVCLFLIKMAGLLK